MSRMRPSSRRRSTVLGGVVLAVTVLVGCGSDDDSGDGGGSSDTEFVGSSELQVAEARLDPRPDGDEWVLSARLVNPTDRTLSVVGVRSDAGTATLLDSLGAPLEAVMINPGDELLLGPSVSHVVVVDTGDADEVELTLSLDIRDEVTFTLPLGEG